MRSEQWYWAPMFVAVSLAIHIGIVLLMRGAGGTGRTGKPTAIEVTLTPGRKTAAPALPGRPRKRLVQSRTQYAAVPQPFQSPPWEQRRPRVITVRRQAATMSAGQSAPLAAPSGAPTAASGMSFGLTGSGQGGFVGASAQLPVIRVSRGEFATRQVPIVSSDGSAVQRRSQAVRARPLTEINAPAIYPEEARAQHLQGTVYLSVAVTAEGKPERVELLFSSGSALLDEAAITAVRGWNFEPGRDESGPISSRISVPYRFNGE